MRARLHPNSTKMLAEVLGTLYFSLSGQSDSRRGYNHSNVPIWLLKLCLLKGFNMCTSLTGS